MSATIPDLWKTDFVKAGTSPVAILREQARLLTAKTNSYLRGDVHTTSTGEGGFLHVFLIKAPSLDGYVYELFSVIHGVPFYPARILSPVFPEGERSVHDQVAYLAALELVLNDPKSAEVVSSLLAQLPDYHP